MTGLFTLIRALRHRVGTTLVVFAVSLCATAAATIGPAYFAAARHSILQDSLHQADVVGRGYEALQQGPIQGRLAPLTAQVDAVVDRTLGGAAVARRVFQPPVEAIEGTAFFQSLGEQIPLVWRTDFCRHLHVTTGRCAANANEIDISAPLGRGNEWHLGGKVRQAVGAPLTIVGIYQPPAVTSDYWFTRTVTYFPAEFPVTPPHPPFDAMFTPRATLDALRGNPQGTVVIDRALAIPRVEPGDLDALNLLEVDLNNSPNLAGVATTTSLSSTVATIHQSWTALSVPVLVVTIELLVLTWLMMFLVVTDAVEARGTEIALAKLRGYGGRRSITFGLGEPLAVLAVSLPVGAAVGWALTGALSHVLLRPGTPVALPLLGWLAAAAAVVGGVAAVVVGARRTLVRPVVEQWRRAGRRATDRSWLFDAIVLTGAAAGLAQLFLGGSIGSAKHSALALLVPGLLGIALAVVGSRLLPLMCRARFARTRDHGGLGVFLAVRHIARRPGGTRTTMILATALALATFSLAAWSVGSTNRSRVAKVSVGAPAVVTVAPSPTQDLRAIVDRIDPTGDESTAVESFSDGSHVLLGVEPQRFARVANWSAGFVQHPAKLLDSLEPPAPAPVRLNGGEIRMSLSTTALSLPGAHLMIDVFASDASAPTPVDLGPLPKVGDTVTRVASLAGCPCVMRDVQVVTANGQPAQISGTVTLGALAVRNSAGWTTIPDAFTTDKWTDTTDQRVRVVADGAHLQWSFFAPAATPPLLLNHDRPDPLPAVAVSALAGSNSTIQLGGLDGNNLTAGVNATVPNVPSAAATGVVVSLEYAERAAFGNLTAATQQVWTRGDVADLQRALAAAHVPVLSMMRSSSVADQFDRQGPGLASVLFLADAAAAAVLAALAAVLSLSAAARRRRYEYAALAATGASRRTLFAALALEQLLVVGFAAVVGVGAGLLSIALAGRSVPEFVATPVSDLLRYVPSPVVLGAGIGGGVVLLLAAAAAAAGALLQMVTPDQLREAPS